MGEVDWSKGATKAQVRGSILMGAVIGTPVSIGLALIGAAISANQMVGLGVYFVAWPLVSVAVFFAYQRVREMAHGIDDRLAARPVGRLGEGRESHELRERFAKHLLVVADAMRAIEWAESGDSSEGAADDAIRKCIGESP